MTPPSTAPDPGPHPGPAPRSDDLADRYGAPSALRRRLVVGVAASVAVLFLGWLAWATFLHSTPTVTSELLGFEVVDDHTTVARVEVAVSDDADPAEVGASCRVTAFAEDHAVVGELSWVPQVGRHEVEVRTERGATSLELAGCTADGQSRPR